LAPLTIAGHKVGLEEASAAATPTDGYLEAFNRAWGSTDLQEGMAAFRERRPADFEGR
jgi:enoyl-CoA hydratase